MNLSASLISNYKGIFNDISQDDIDTFGQEWYLQNIIQLL